jgi:EAL domain-containing protein (putative c-di-GMP-specific phosphodiesterase class I)/FixJ family two-component response regulator
VTDATVLIVDDDASSVMLLELLLRDAGVAAVHGLTDAREAVARCLELRPDLVLLDLHMPHMDGCAVLAALQVALPPNVFLPVLVLTGDASPAARKDALDAGAKDFLTKPFDHVETVLRVRNLLETAALYRTVQSHNEQLLAELHARGERERQVSAERRRRRERIERVMHDGTLQMVFQPIVDLRGGGLVGVEALARFDCEPRRPPDAWFAEAAEVGLGAELELTAVEAAVRELDRVPSGGFMTVNVSASAVLQADLEGVLSRTPATRIVLELTEHTRIEDYEPVRAAIAAHHRRGVRLAVDDTGAGYAGLQHLLRLRPDIIKLDIDLTRGIDVDPARHALAGALMTFAHEIDAMVVAEGIETSGELEALQALHVPWGQGFHVAEPHLLPSPAHVPRVAPAWPAAGSRLR